MKRYLFLIVLVFFVTIFVLGDYAISVRLITSDQNVNSKTKEMYEIHASKVLSDTEDVKLTKGVISIGKIEKRELPQFREQKIENLEEKTAPKVEEQKEIQEQVKPQEEVNQQEKIIQQEAGKPEASVEIEPVVAQEPIRVNYSFLIISENVSAENAKLAERELSRIPQNMLNAFMNDGWTMNVSNENIAQKYFGGAYSNVMGVTITDAKVIAIQNREKSIRSAVVHEFGHYIDCKFDFPSTSDEFYAIYEEEAPTFKSRIPNSGCVSNELEFFAHTFYYLITDPSKCTPRATEFVQRYMNSI